MSLLNENDLLRDSDEKTALNSILLNFFPKYYGTFFFGDDKSKIFLSHFVVSLTDDEFVFVHDYEDTNIMDAKLYIKLSTKVNQENRNIDYVEIIITDNPEYYSSNVASGIWPLYEKSDRRCDERINDAGNDVEWVIREYPLEYPFQVLDTLTVGYILKWLESHRIT